MFFGAIIAVAVATAPATNGERFSRREAIEAAAYCLGWATPVAKALPNNMAVQKNLKGHLTMINGIVVKPTVKSCGAPYVMPQFQQKTGDTVLGLVALKTGESDEYLYHLLVDLGPDADGVHRFIGQVAVEDE
ncbi:MAG: hypothetical protein AB202_03465 [Parcubacteria bacterium C7867-007]|nr:MAG: hypothetical protein AB202_03465 [Parcubacteria bacterium C7867-007]